MLASIQIIYNIRTHPNADNLELADVLGWQVIIRKGEFVENDLCVYFALDSILPAIPEFEFLAPRKYRISNVKIRKEYSQGMAYSLGILKVFNINIQQLKVGDDVTDLVGVIKYEKPIPIGCSGLDAGRFPAVVPKTDELNGCNYLGVIEEIAGKPYYISVKEDGTSLSFVHFNNEINVCSRSRMLKEFDDKGKTNKYWEVVKRYNMLESIPKMGNFAIQGELCGPSIQTNPMGLKDFDLFVFQVYDIEQHRYLDYAEFIEFCSVANLKTVPVLEVGEQFGYTLQNLKDLSIGLYDGTSNQREGIVIRPQKECFSKALEGRMSFKIINPLYKD